MARPNPLDLTVCPTSDVMEFPLRVVRQLRYQFVHSMQFPGHAMAHCNLGTVLAERGDIAGAARLFAAALKIDPSDAGVKANLQQALRMLKEEHRKV